jgi:hypothetical protein
MNETLGVLVAVVLLGGCASMSCKPVEETDFDRLAGDGCTRDGNRFAVTAKVSSATSENIVLWNGFGIYRTVSVRLTEQNLRRKARGWFGKNRYELSCQRLNELRERSIPITVALRSGPHGASGRPFQPFRERPARRTRVLSGVAR